MNNIKVKNYFKILLLLILAIPFSFLLTSCGDEPEKLLKFTGVTFDSLTCDYDGQEHEVVVNGDLPDGAVVEYQKNKATNSGEYIAVAKISLEGYKPLVLSATLKINKLNYDMSNTYWNYDSETTFTYNGTSQSVEVVGLPQGVTVKNYQNNSKVNAGEYTASVAFNYDTLNHNAPTFKNLNWQIQKATYDMSNVKWSYESPFLYNGSQREITLTGLPQGVTVKSYSNNIKVEAGTYTASATLNYDNQNYNEITLPNCVWKILPNLSNLAFAVVNSLVKVPDPWEFLPESFSIENKLYNGSAEIDFTSFVNVSSLPKTAMGKQMNVVYSTLLDTEKAIGYLKYIYGSINVIVDLYQKFINTNNDNYKNFEKQTDNFTFKITLNDSDYQMLISYKSVAIELSYQLNDKKCYGRIQLTDTVAVKYEMAENSLTIGYNVLNVALVKLHFERSGENVNGYLIEYYGTETKNIKTSALIKVDKNYTTIISNKRETDDLIIQGYMEIYSNATGNLIGAEVKETVKNTEYDTSWFNLYDVTNINTIKVEDDTNGVNADTIYINGSENPIKTKLVGITGGSKATSRRFDIEMKVMYLYTYNAEEEKYEKNKIEIPMLFVQNEFLNSFSEDFYSANKNTGAISPTKINLSSTDSAFLLSKYQNLIDEYLVLKSKVTYLDIKGYVGEKSAYFNS